MYAATPVIYFSCQINAGCRCCSDWYLLPFTDYVDAHPCWEKTDQKTKASSSIREKHLWIYWVTFTDLYGASSVTSGHFHLLTQNVLFAFQQPRYPIQLKCSRENKLRIPNRRRKGKVQRGSDTWGHFTRQEFVSLVPFPIKQPSFTCPCCQTHTGK